MASSDIGHLLRSHGVQPSSQRLAIARYVLFTTEHPSADEVWERARKLLPFVSRATVYNTLNLFVTKGLLKELVLAEGKIVFDPLSHAHHHFVDEATGKIIDVPWGALEVRNVQNLERFEIRAYEVVLRGRLKTKKNGEAK